MIDLRQGDCLEVMRTLPDNSVDMILTDPPYFRYKDDGWDRQWTSESAFLEWVGDVVAQLARVLKSNGSFYWFASPSMSDKISAQIASHLSVLNHIVWVKGSPGNRAFSRGNSASKEALRAFFPASERIIFAEHYGQDSMALGESGYAAQCEQLRGFVFEPLRRYFDDERVRCGISMQEIMDGMAERGCGRFMFARHTFTRSQWQLPTEETYRAARELFDSKGGDFLRREYEDLRREYEDLRREYEDLRRPFFLDKGRQWSDVWFFDPVLAYDGKHPCEKPVALLAHMIEASTRPGDTILDPFSGSGSTLIASHRFERSAIGIELNPDYVELARQRIAAETPSLFAGIND